MASCFSVCIWLGMGLKHFAIPPRDYHGLNTWKFSKVLYIVPQHTIIIIIINKE